MVRLVQRLLSSHQHFENINASKINKNRGSADANISQQFCLSRRVHKILTDEDSPYSTLTTLFVVSAGIPHSSAVHVVKLQSGCQGGSSMPLLCNLFSLNRITTIIQTISSYDHLILETGKVRKE